MITSRQLFVMEVTKITSGLLSFRTRCFLFSWLDYWNIRASGHQFIRGLKSGHQGISCTPVPVESRSKFVRGKMELEAVFTNAALLYLTVGLPVPIPYSIVGARAD